MLYVASITCPSNSIHCRAAIYDFGQFDMFFKKPLQLLGPAPFFGTLASVHVFTTLLLYGNISNIWGKSTCPGYIKIMCVCRDPSTIWWCSSRTAFRHGISQAMRRSGTWCLSPCEWEGSAWTYFYSETPSRRKLWSHQKWAERPSPLASSGERRMSP